MSSYLHKEASLLVHVIFHYPNITSRRQDMLNNEIP